MEELVELVRLGEEGVDTWLPNLMGTSTTMTRGFCGVGLSGPAILNGTIPCSPASGGLKVTSCLLRLRLDLDFFALDLLLFALFDESVDTADAVL